VHASFGSFVATGADVSVAGAAIRVHRMVTAIDCGIEMVTVSILPRNLAGAGTRLLSDPAGRRR
jgi:CO/xanthine dehydrogenase Mo-binding subunit